VRRAAALALAVALVAGCGGGDDDEADADTGLSRRDAAIAVDHAVLDADDLGDGWDEIDPPAEEPFGPCFADLGSPLAVEGPVAFIRDGDGPIAVTRLLVGTVAVDDPHAVDALLEGFDEEALTACLVEGFSTVAGDTELGLEVGDAEVEHDYVPLEGVRSAHVRIPFSASAPGLDLDAELDVVVVSRDQLVSTMLTIGLGELVDGEDVARWSALLADRQRVEE
jgi:hypothetical protein